MKSFSLLIAALTAGAPPLKGFLLWLWDWRTKTSTWSKVCQLARGIITTWRRFMGRQMWHSHSPFWCSPPSPKQRELLAAQNRFQVLCFKIDILERNINKMNENINMEENWPNTTSFCIPLFLLLFLNHTGHNFQVEVLCKSLFRLRGVSCFYF